MSQQDAWEALRHKLGDSLLTRRKFVQSTGLLGLSVLASSSLLAACGGDDDDDDTDTAAEEDSDAVTEPTAASDNGDEDSDEEPTESAADGDDTDDTDADGDEPRSGGSLVYGIDNQLQPFTYATPWVAEAQWDIYERLLDVDPNGELTPYLAETFEVSDDGLTITLTLKEGKTYHNGDPVNAQAIKAVFDRWTAPDSDYSETYFTNVAEVEAADERTVVLTLSEPDTNALWGMAYAYSPIVNMAVVEANPDDYGQTVVVGSGPFKFETWEGDSVTVVKNPDYSGPPSYIKNQGPPHLDKITYTFLPDASTRTINVESGEYDLVINPAPQDIARLENNPDITIITQPAIALLYMGFNFKEGRITTDRAVREAISHAIDRQSIVDEVLFGYAVPAYSPVVPHDPDYWEGAEDLYPYDLDKARQILDEAGWVENGGTREKDGQQLNLNMIILGTSEQETVAQVVQSQLGQIGVSVEIEVLDKGTHQQRQLDGEYDLNFFRYLYDSSIQVLKILYHSETIPPNGANWAYYVNPKADELFAAFRSAKTPEERSQAIIDVQKVLLEDIVQVPLYNPLNVWALNKWVRGFEPNPHSIYTLHNDMWVTEDSPRS